MTGVTLDSRAVRPGDLYAALPGARAHGADFAGQAAARRRGRRAHRPRRASTGCRGRRRPAGRWSSSDPRAVLGGGRRARLRRPAPRAAPGRRHRHQRQDHDRLPRATRPCAPLGRRTGLIGTVETRIGDERRRAACAPPPRRPTCTPARGDARARRRRLRRWRSPATRWRCDRVDGVVFDVAAVHQPVAGPPRLPRGHGGLLRAKASLFTPERARRGRGLRRRRVRPAAGRARPPCPSSPYLAARAPTPTGGPSTSPRAAGGRRSRCAGPAADAAAAVGRCRALQRGQRRCWPRRRCWPAGVDAASRRRGGRSPSRGVPGRMERVATPRGRRASRRRRLRAHAGRGRGRPARRCAR